MLEMCIVFENRIVNEATCILNVLYYMYNGLPNMPDTIVVWLQLLIFGFLKADS